MSPERLRILYVTDVSIARVIGGSERVIMEETTRLARRGHTVHILGRTSDPKAAGEELIQSIREFRYRIPTDRASAAFVFAAVRAAALFRALVAQGHYDVIHFLHPFSSFGVHLARPRAGRTLYTFLSSIAAEFEIRFRGVLTAPRFGAERWLRNRTEEFSLQRVGDVRTLSRYSERQLREYHPRLRKPVTVIPGGVDTERFQPHPDRGHLRESLRIPPDSFFMFTVRNLVPRMGLENLLAAMPAILKDIPSAYLVIGGHGYLLDRLQGAATALGIADRIRFEGYIPDERLMNYYQAADVFGLPTASLEGFGLIILEAMACGTPVIGTPVGAIPELLEGGAGGYLTASASAQDIAVATIRFHREVFSIPDAYEQIRGICRGRVVDTYDWERIVDRLEELMRPAPGSNRINSR